MKFTRRKFLIGTGVVGGGLVLGFNLRVSEPFPNLRENTFQPNAWLQISPENDVILQVAKAEMGQGVLVSMPTIVGEELDFDPARIITEFAGVHPAFASPPMGQTTGGSTSVATSWTPLREAGAAARQLLLRAASRRWEIEESACTTDDGIVTNSVNDERLTFGELVPLALSLTDKEGNEVEFKLKDSDSFRWIGRESPRTDSTAKSTGTAEFGIDVLLPGMKIAVVVRPPHFGGSVESWAEEETRQQPGVVDAFEIHSGIAIVADSYWEARKAADRMDIHWQKGPLAGLDTEVIRVQQREALDLEEPHMAVEEGSMEALDTSARVIEAEYSAPFLAHNTMEPQNATALVDGDKCEIWLPSQGPDIVRNVAAHFSGLKRQDITVNSTLLGGGFGRRAYVDFAGEVVVVAQRMSGTPVKLIWSREDDIQHDYYRPATLHRLKGALDGDGRPIGWQHTIACPSLLQGFAVDMVSNVLPSWVPLVVARALGKTVGNIMAKRDPITAEGAHIPYSVPNVAVGQVLHDAGIPVGFWRSVGHSYNAFVVESFVDELAHLAAVDAAEFRLEHLQHKPRHLGVLKLALEKGAWGTPATGHTQGLAVHESFDSFAAMLIEVSVRNNSFRVERVVAAVDCGRVINPGIVRSQVQSAIVYGLGAAMKDPVTIRDGRVLQSNFNDLPVLRINECPDMEVHIVDSEEEPTGIGEIGTPPVAPALANALFAATGERLRSLPLKLGSA